MKDFARVLCLFDYAATTGFATVSQNITYQLRNHFGPRLKLDIRAINYFGEPFQPDENTWVFSASLHQVREHLKNPMQEGDPFGRIEFLDALGSCPGVYDGIFIILDLPVIALIIPFLKEIQDKKFKEFGKKFKSIFYFPIDGKMPARAKNKAIDSYEVKYKDMEIPAWMSEEYVEPFKGLEFFDMLVTYTEYGRAEVLRHRPDLQKKVKVIPHGTNMEHFHVLPQDERAAFRKEYFGEENAGKFIITNINRNQYRKDIPNTIFGFIECKELFAEAGMPEPFLYLHMHPNDPMGWNLRTIMEQTELVEGKDYKLLDESIGHHGATISQLNQIYNASDVYLTTVTGGGWELPVTEAFSAGLPVICPNHTSLAEISGNGIRAVLLTELFPVVAREDNTIRYGTHVDEIAEKLLSVARYTYDFDKLPPESEEKKISDKIIFANKYVIDLSWDKICVRWIEYWKKCFF